MINKNYTDISLDLETFGKIPRSVIASIGAVAFNRCNLEGGGCETFEVFIDFDDQVKSGREMNGSTLRWWLSQSQDARKALTEGAKESICLYTALTKLRDFIQSNCNLNQVRVWGNGASFDNAMLADAFDQVGIVLPWKFWNDRCLRTLLGELEETTGRKLKDEVSFSGVKHSALSDAFHQANLIITATSLRGPIL